jgi:hypothetical protein
MRKPPPARVIALVEGARNGLRSLGIEMIVHAGGRERTRDEYAALFASAGLRLTRVIATAGPASVVEAEAS